MTRRWSMAMGGLAVAAVAVGVAVMVAQQRHLSDGWREYNPEDEEEEQRSRFHVARAAVAEVAKSAASLGVDKVTAVAGSARERTSDLIGSRRTAEPV